VKSEGKISLQVSKSKLLEIFLGISFLRTFQKRKNSQNSQQKKTLLRQISSEKNFFHFLEIQKDLPSFPLDLQSTQKKRV